MADELLDVLLSATKETGKKSGQKFDVEDHHKIAMQASE